MTTTETTETSVGPPGNYPHETWSEAPDYFAVAEPLRHWYCQPEAAPTPKHTERLWESSGTLGLGPVTVQALKLDDQGRYVPVPPHQVPEVGRRGDLYAGWRQSTTVVDPRQGTGTLAFKTFEHQIRLTWAAQAAEDDARQESSYQMALIRCCPVCGHQYTGALHDPFFGSASLCERCVAGVKAAAAERHHPRYRAQIDAWLDEHEVTWEPRPPQRQAGRGFHRGR